MAAASKGICNNISLPIGLVVLAGMFRQNIFKTEKEEDGAKQRTVNTFFTTLTAGSGDSGAYFVAVQQRDQTVTDATSKTSSVQYSYDPYGNVTREIRSGDTATTSDDRNTERSFVYNLTAYIVNQPAWEKLWTGAISGTAGQEKAFTEYAYDTLA